MSRHTMSARLVPLNLLLAFAILPAHAQAQAPEAQITTQQMIANARKLVAVDADGCLQNTSENENEIIVCGSYAADRKYRLPLPTQPDSGERISEPIPNGDATYVNTGRCYIDASERQCFKGLHIVGTSFGGGNGSAAPLWQVIKSEAPDAVYGEELQIVETDTPQ